MSDFADEELLSAYLDGELTAADQARVERLLGEQPESRQLLDELRSLKIGLERMPRARLGHDFADSVLRQAEREMLLGDDGEGDGAAPSVREPSPVGAGRPVDSADRAERLSGLSWQRIRRPAIWASLALAAGLLIMFFDREVARQPREQQVALAPGEAGERGRGEIGAPAAAPAEPESENRPSAEDQEETKNTGAYYRRSDPQADKRILADAPSPAAPATGKPASMSRAAGSSGRSLAPSSGEKAAADESAKEARRETFGLKREMAGDSDADAAQLSLVTNDETLVVWCEVAPDAEYDASFRDLLATQNIKWGDEAELSELDALQDRPLKSQLGRSQASAGTPADGAEKPRNEQEPTLGAVMLQRAEGRQKRLADAEQAVRDPNTELVLVDATEAQIKAVLAGLDKEVFVSVDVEPAPGSPRQEPLARFGRGLVESEKLGERIAEAKAKKDVKKAPQAAAGGATALSKTPAQEANQNASPQGIARKLSLPSAASLEQVPEKLDKAKQSLSAVPQLAKEADDKSLRGGVEREKAQAAGPAARGGEAENRYQVLFVLHPRETEKPAAAAAPPDKNDQ